MSDKKESPSPAPLSRDFIIARKFKLVRKLGAGSFGEVHSGIQLSDGEDVAIKIEPISVENCNDSDSAQEISQLKYECHVYQKMQGGIGIPRLRWFGQESNYNVLVIQRLGLSLEDLFNICERHFSLKTVLQLADQLITRLEFFHSRNYIHRDIKPENCLTGLGPQSSRLYLIDYGLAKRYRDASTHQHVKYLQGRDLTGTARYSSLNASLGGTQSRRDDLESLGFVFLYFLRGSLPWQGLQAANQRQKYQKIAEKKLSTTINSLCEGYPAEFTIYLTYARTLMFEEEPDYTYLQQVFRLLFRNMGYKYDYIFDWSSSPDTRVREMLAYKSKKMLDLERRRSRRELPVNDGEKKDLKEGQN